MSTPLSDSQIQTLHKLDAEQRYQYLIQQAIANGQVWILTDEYGSVMFNTDDEDGVPVWPHQELAQAWATGDWSDCKPECVSLDVWHSRWTSGLTEDELAVVAFPNLDEEGLVMSPSEFDAALKK